MIDIGADPVDDGGEVVWVELTPDMLADLPPEEVHDIHEIDAALDAALAGGGRRPAGAPKPTVVKKLRIAKGFESTVYSYRPGRPNGGVIPLRACVHHIPVMHNTAGRGDLDLLWDVLVDQGLMVQFGDDAEGNCGMYTQANRLCYHARGGNRETCGVEHMHWGSEAWTIRQMNIAGWEAQYLEREYGLPLQMADVEPAGPGLVTIVRKGHTSHRKISLDAGYRDRDDPPHNFDYEQMFARAKFFKGHGHFIGA